VTTDQLAISGSSSDGTSGVSQGQLSIMRSSDGFFWTGSDWTREETWLATSGSAGAWNYLWISLPKVGMATIRSRAIDNVGNVEIPGAGAIVTLRRGYDISIPIIISELFQ